MLLWPYDYLQPKNYDGDVMYTNSSFPSSSYDHFTWLNTHTPVLLQRVLNEQLPAALHQLKVKNLILRIFYSPLHLMFLLSSEVYQVQQHDPSWGHVCMYWMWVWFPKWSCGIFCSDLRQRILEWQQVGSSSTDSHQLVAFVYVSTRFYRPQSNGVQQMNWFCCYWAQTLCPRTSWSYSDLDDGNIWTGSPPVFVTIIIHPNKKKEVTEKHSWGSLSSLTWSNYCWHQLTYLSVRACPAAAAGVSPGTLPVLVLVFPANIKLNVTKMFSDVFAALVHSHLGAITTYTA